MNIYTKMALGLMDNPNFRKWFGESKVIDDAGEPLRVYHGSTSKKLNVIDPRAAVETRGVSWFSDNPDVSEIFRYPREYGEVLWDSKPGAMIEGHLNITKPLVIEGKLAQDITYDSALQQRVVRQAINDGYDGIILKNVKEGVGDAVEPGTTYGIFSPTQVKSVRNRGKFDPTDPNILKSLAAPVAIGAAGAMIPFEAGAAPSRNLLAEAMTQVDPSAPVGANLEARRRRAQAEALQDAFNPIEYLAPARWGGGLINMGIDALLSTVGN